MGRSARRGGGAVAGGAGGVGGARVALVGASGRAGRVAALLLRCSPWVAHLALHDRAASGAAVRSLGRALVQDVPGRGAVSAYAGLRQLTDAVEGSHVVMMMMGKERQPDEDAAEIFSDNAPAVQNVALATAACAPRALLAVLTPPLNCTLPLAAETLARAGHPAPYAHALGVAPAAAAAARALAAGLTSLHPAAVRVPLVGGACYRSAVPLLSAAHPPGALDLPQSAAEQLRRAIRAECEGGREAGQAQLSAGRAAARLAEKLAKAALGVRSLRLTAFVRSSVLPSAPYLASSLLVGPMGIVTNLGLPPASRSELLLLDEALAVVCSDLALALAYLERQNPHVSQFSPRHMESPAAAAQALPGAR